MKPANRYPKKGCRHLASLFRSGGKIPDLAREIGCSEMIIRRWIKQADRPDRHGDLGPPRHEIIELMRLREECRRLMQERDVLLKAVARFEKETSDLQSPLVASAQEDTSAIPTEAERVTAWLQGLT